MLSDSYFEQGVSHEVCEDYALHGENYAIISDGCSNGGGPSINSDWGARILCKAAEVYIGEITDTRTLLEMIEFKSTSILSAIRVIEPDCLTATLMMLNIVDEKFHAFCIGDGIVGGKRKDGRWKIHAIRFPRGPYYLKYKMFNEESCFFEKFGDKYTIGTYFGNIMSKEAEPPQDMPPMSERHKIWSQQMSYSEKEYSLDPKEPFNIFEFPVEDYDFAFVCSDGMESFYQPKIGETQKYNEDISVLDALRVVMDFVTIAPNFARHQRNWVFKQNKAGTLIRRGWKNFDDVSVGVIHV